MNSVKDIVVQITGALTVFCVIGALVLYALNNFTDATGAKGQTAFIMCIVGAIACGAATTLASNTDALDIAL